MAHQWYIALRILLICYTLPTQTVASLLDNLYNGTCLETPWNGFLNKSGTCSQHNMARKYEEILNSNFKNRPELVELPWAHGYMFVKSKSQVVLTLHNVARPPTTSHWQVPRSLVVVNPSLPLTYTSSTNWKSHYQHRPFRPLQDPFHGDDIVKPWSYTSNPKIHSATTLNFFLYAKVKMLYIYFGILPSLVRFYLSKSTTIWESHQ